MITAEMPCRSNVRTVNTKCSILPPVSPSKMIGFVVHSRILFKSCKRVVRSTASMSGLPLLVESVRLLDHIPSKTSRLSPFCTSRFSMISPQSPSCASKIRTIGLASIKRRNDFKRTSGVVPIVFISLSSPDELIPCVYGISITFPPCSFITSNTCSRISRKGPLFQSSPWMI